MTVIVTYRDNVPNFIKCDYIFDLKYWTCKYWALESYPEWVNDIITHSG